MFTLTSDYPFDEDNFEGNFQVKISPSDKYIEQLEEELIEFKGKNKWKQTSSHKNTF